MSSKLRRPNFTRPEAGGAGANADGAGGVTSASERLADYTRRCHRRPPAPPPCGDDSDFEDDARDPGQADGASENGEAASNGGSGAGGGGAGGKRDGDPSMEQCVVSPTLGRFRPAEPGVTGRGRRRSRRGGAPPPGTTGEKARTRTAKGEMTQAMRRGMR